MPDTSRAQPWRTYARPTFATDVVGLDCGLQYCVSVHSPQSSSNRFEKFCILFSAALFMYGQSPNLDCVGESGHKNSTVHWLDVFLALRCDQ